MFMSKKKVGRPVKINISLINEAEKLLKAGNYVSTICEYLHIDNKTWYNWLNKGVDAKEETIYRRFHDIVKTAEAMAEIRAVAIIQQKMTEDWRCAMTYLERKFPHKWGRQYKNDYNDNDQPIEININPSHRVKNNKKKK